MKLGLISRGRTRSTTILFSLTEQNQLRNFGEDYFRAHIILKEHLEIRRNLDSEKIIKLFEQKINEITNQMFTHGNFGCKIFTSMFVTPPSHIIKNTDTLSTIKSRTIFDATKYFRLQDYDKLYFLDRNLHDSAVSWIYTRKTKLYHTWKGEEKLSYTTIDLNEEDYGRAKFYVLEYILQQKLKKYMIEKSISFTEIDDSNYQEYLSESSPLEKNLVDYKDVIQGYQQLLEFIDKTYIEYSSAVDDWNFY
jgi:hypothetical protein